MHSAPAGPADQSPGPIQLLDPVAARRPTEALTPKANKPPLAASGLWTYFFFFFSDIPPPSFIHTRLLPRSCCHTVLAAGQDSEILVDFASLLHVTYAEYGRLSLFVSLCMEFCRTTSTTCLAVETTLITLSPPYPAHSRSPSFGTKPLNCTDNRGAVLLNVHPLSGRRATLACDLIVPLDDTADRKGRHRRSGSLLGAGALSLFHVRHLVQGDIHV